MAKDKNSFVLYANYIDIFNALTNEQAGLLIKHILNYVNDLNPEESDDPVIKISWTIIKRQLKDDLKRYEDKRNQLRANANKKYEKQTNVCNCMQMEANATNCNDLHYVNDNVNVNVNDNVNNKITIEDNIERERIAHTRKIDIINELIEIIIEKYPFEFTENNQLEFKKHFYDLLNKYTESNVKRSTYHALQKTLEKEFLDNPIGYLWNAISINCEQFKGAMN